MQHLSYIISKTNLKIQNKIQIENGKKILNSKTSQRKIKLEIHLFAQTCHRTVPLSNFEDQFLKNS